MQQPAGTTTTTRNDSPDTNSELDLTSPFFNPDLALKVDADKIIGLDSRAVPLDNLFKARSLLPVDDVEYREAYSTPVLDEETAAAIRKSKRTAPNSLTYESPLIQIASSFSTDSELSSRPMSLLARLMNKRVRVIQRRDKGRVGRIEGTLKGFDHLSNLLLRDATEYRHTDAREWLEVSTKRRHRETSREASVERFLLNFPRFSTSTIKDSTEYTRERIMNRFPEKNQEIEMWKYLHRVSGLLDTVVSLYRRFESSSRMPLDELVNMAEKVLLERIGNERHFLMHLTTKVEGKPKPSPGDSCEWIKLPSRQHPGNFYYYNNETRQTVWEAPEGVEFRKLARRVGDVDGGEKIKNLLIRGDCVVSIGLALREETRRNEHNKRQRGEVKKKT